MKAIYKTSDGSAFESERQAISHQKQLDLEEELHDVSYEGYGEYDLSLICKHLIENYELTKRRDKT